jgi:2,4-dienoyl-CoA reductase-like NADH-dependent reductase (Old Yellow Enzyme family)
MWDLEKQIAKFEKVVVKKHPDLVAYADMLIANPEFVSNWLLSMGWENE